MLPVRKLLLYSALLFLPWASTTFVSCLTDKKCSTGQCLGNDGNCYSCSAGAVCTKTPSGNCSTPQGGIYCCTGSSGTTSGTAYCNPGNTYNYSSQKCCPNSAPYYYPGTHGIKAAGCYTSCPYVGDCGTQWTKY